jgi:D-3-phosphoglycerate dehydrogenase
VSPFKVALVALNNYAVPEWVSAPLRAAGIEFVAEECASRAALARVAGDADVVWVFGSHQCLYAENLDVLPRCGAIIRSGSGTDNVPVAEATALGILVANTPQATADPVSDHALALLFAVGRQVVVNDRAMRAGDWVTANYMPHWRLQGRTVGLLGFGNIPRALARKLRGFEVTLLAHDPWIDPAQMAAHGARPASLDDLLRQSDVVSIHTPLTPETRHSFGARELALMKPTAILVNTSRGPVVDEPALIQALAQRRIAGAGLDVFDQEPLPADSPLLQLDNVVLTPHVGGNSDESIEQFWRLSVQAALDLAAGRWPASVVNRAVTPRWNLAN